MPSIKRCLYTLTSPSKCVRKLRVRSSEPSNAKGIIKLSVKRREARKKLTFSSAYLHFINNWRCSLPWFIPHFTVVSATPWMDPLHAILASWVRHSLQEYKYLQSSQFPPPPPISCSRQPFLSPRSHISRSSIGRTLLSIRLHFQACLERLKGERCYNIT